VCAHLCEKFARKFNFKNAFPLTLTVALKKIKIKTAKKEPQNPTTMTCKVSDAGRLKIKSNKLTFFVFSFAHLNLFTPGFFSATLINCQLTALCLIVLPFVALAVKKCFYLRMNSKNSLIQW